MSRDIRVRQRVANRGGGGRWDMDASDQWAAMGATGVAEGAAVLDWYATEIPAAGGEGSVSTGLHRIGANLTIPYHNRKGLALRPGAGFTVDAGATLTIEAPIKAGRYQIFFGPGAVKLGRRAARRVYPEWWGAEPDGVTNCAPAIQAGCESMAGAHVSFGLGDYRVATSIKPPSGTTLAGAGYGSRILCPAAGWSLAAQDGGLDVYGIITLRQRAHVTIKGLRLFGTKAGLNQTTPKLVYMEGTHGLSISGCWLEHTAYEAVWQGGPQDANTGLRFVDNHVEDCAISVDWVGLPAVQLNVDGAVVTGNYLIDVGIGFAASGSRINLSGNTILRPRRDGIQTGDAAESGINTIANNTIELDVTVPGAGQLTGIYLTGSAAAGPNRTLHVTGNTILIRGVAGTVLARGIYVDRPGQAALADNLVEIVGVGIGYLVAGSEEGNRVTTHNNQVRVRGETGQCFGFQGRGGGAGRSLRWDSAGDRVYGLSEAAASYAWDVSTMDGGAITLQIESAYAEGGYIGLLGELHHGLSAPLTGTPFSWATPAAHAAQISSVAVGMLSLVEGPELGLVGDTLTITGVHAGSQARRSTMLRIDSETGDGVDTLTTITGGRDGDVLLLMVGVPWYQITLSAGGNLRLAGPFVLTGWRQILLVRRMGQWVEITRSSNT